MNIVKHELKMSYKSLFSYTLSMFMVFSIFLFFFGAFKEGAALIDKLLQNFPPEFKAAFGFADVNLSEFNGYLSFIFGYIVLIGAVFAMKLGLSVLSEETRVKTADFLLSKPIKRTQIVTAKLFSVLILVIIQNVILYTLTLTETLIVINNDFSLKVFTLLSMSILLVQLFFIGVGMFLSVIIKKIKNVMPITLGVVFGFFIIELVNQSLLEAKLTYLTPFSYFKGSSIISSAAYDIKYLLLDLVFFAILITLSYVVYQRKDIHAV